MVDREKVMKGLECCILRNPDDHARCSQCPYGSNCINRLKMGALKLLKEKEAENGDWITIWREDDPDTSTQARCSICNRISERPLGGYCKWCGTKMNQEWGVARCHLTMRW